MLRQSLATSHQQMDAQPVSGWEQSEKQKSWPCTSTTQQQLNYWHVFNTCFGHRCKTQYFTGCYEEKLTLSQPDPV